MGLTKQSLSVWVIVVAAGSATRFGELKQFLHVAGERIVDRAVATAARHAAGVVVVLPAGHSSDGGPITGAENAVIRVVEGAGSRAGSVRRGLAAVPADVDVVLVHDGARPLAPDSVYESVISAVVDGADAAVPVVAVTDTIRRVEGGVVDRSELVAVQTPQGFPAAVLRSAHANEADATDDATLVEAEGGTVVLVDGHRRNLKITTPLDLRIAEALLSNPGEQDD